MPPAKERGFLTFPKYAIEARLGEARRDAAGRDTQGLPHASWLMPQASTQRCVPRKPPCDDLRGRAEAQTGAVSKGLGPKGAEFATGNETQRNYLPPLGT